MNKEERELITISFVGTKKFKQFLVDKIHELLTSEDVFDKVGKPGCGFTFNSLIEPSEENCDGILVTIHETAIICPTCADAEITRLKADRSDFFAGIITALAILRLHDSETIYREVINTMGKDDLRALIKHARKNDELEFSGLVRYGYIKNHIKGKS